jgi:putative zinc finger protein
MSDSEQIRDLIERLGAFEPAHPTFDELAGYVDGQLDPISREVVDSHLEGCQRCRRELRDLQAFAKPASSRRWWIGGAGIAAALALAFFLMRPAPPTRELHIPQYALNLRAQTMALRGRTTPGGPEPLAPLGAVVINNQPSFTWNRVPNARYRVEVFDTKFRSVTASGLLDATRWTPSAPLPRGGTYLWQVTAVTPSGSVTAPQPPSPEARFLVLDAPHADELARLEKSEARPSLALGVAYAEAGVLDAAERELRAVDSAEARRFLRALEQTAR